jgi:hypothetical protein
LEVTVGFIASVADDEATGDVAALYDADRPRHGYVANVTHCSEPGLEPELSGLLPICSTPTSSHPSTSNGKRPQPLPGGTDRNASRASATSASSNGSAWG